VTASSVLPPGPRLPGSVQTLWYTFGQPSFFTACRRRFGRTWSIRLPGFPPIVITSDRDAVRRLLTGAPLVRRHGNDLFEPVLGRRSVMLLEPEEHLARRRLELPPFHGDAVRSYADRIRELAEAEIASWQLGSVVATHPRLRALTLAIILELVLGVRDEQLRAELVDIFDAFASPANNLGLFLPPAFKRRAWWNPGAELAFRRVDQLDQLLREHISAVRRDSALDARADVLALLARARDEDGDGLSDVDLRDDLVTLVIAGHETTATAIAWACDLLAHHPAVTRHLRETLAAGEREYLKATAKEVLRARTLLYVSAGRHVLEPFELGNYVLGADTLIFVDAQGLHRDPELHPRPDAFEPERFLEDPPDGYSYVPFGGGAHHCLGAALATLELELFLEILVTRVELSPAGPPARAVRRGVTLAPSHQARVRVRSLQTSGGGW
jgi:cytochrome P450 family 135